VLDHFKNTKLEVDDYVMVHPNVRQRFAPAQKPAAGKVSPMSTYVYSLLSLYCC